jgi:putative flippase GtrA
MRQFIYYCLCGGLGVGVDLLSYYLALQSGLWYQTANIIGYSLGTFVSFLLNRALTFNVKDKVFIRLLSFFGVAFIGFIASSILLYLLVDILNIESRISKLLTLPFVVLIQFSINRKFTFKG